MAATGHQQGSLVVVVPCFNEAERLPPDELTALTADPNVSALLVDDGSTDATFELATALAATTARLDVLRLPVNCGKAEAVRRGLLAALDRNPELVGYVDADFATPAAEVLRLARSLTASPNVDVVIASRVLLSGRTILRSPVRHVLGRIVATYLSLTYDLQIYDTQCGTKLFRVDDRLVQALSRPFTTRWLFDVELLIRVRDEADMPARVREEPLEQWRDVSGSHLSSSQMRQVVVDFAALARAASKRGQAPPAGGRSL